MGDDTESSGGASPATRADATTAPDPATDVARPDAEDARLEAGDTLERHAVRALLVTPEPALLLLKVAAPAPLGELWIAPGGGIEPGEAPAAALQREVHEETGLASFTPGPQVWRRSVTFRMGQRRITQHERYWLVPMERFVPCTDQMPEGPERTWFREIRWWPLAEILASRERFVPSRVGRLLRGLLERGAPHTPVDVGL